jgi:hypothetical protein
MNRLMLTAAAFGLAFAAPAMAQTSGTAPAPSVDDLPYCSKDVRDRCKQGPRAESMASQTWKGGGNDNSARMTASQAAQGSTRKAPR